ncbi:MAG: LPS assembly lipoprotein LptE [Myxococcota bacterium]
MRAFGRGLLVVSVALAAGCGYRFTAPGSELVGGLRSVHVPMFDNRTAEPGAELVFTRAARAQLERAGRLGDANAEGTLVGSIVAVSGGPFLSSAAFGRQPVFRLNVTVSLSVVKGGVTLASTTVTSSEEFPSGADPLLTESNRGTALQRAAEVAVREGLERLEAPTR